MLFDEKTKQEIEKKKKDSALNEVDLVVKRIKELVKENSFSPQDAEYAKTFFSQKIDELKN